MRAVVFSGLLLCALFSSEFLHAQAAADQQVAGAGIKVPAPSKLRKLSHRTIYPGDVFYPDTLAKEGVQGEVVIEVRLLNDGKERAVKIISSSKSDDLDKRALAYVNSESWIMPEENPKDSEAHYQQSVIFSRDSILTINLKTCAELNTDMGYFHSVRPDDPVKNVQSLELIASLFTVQLIKTQGAAEALKYAKAVHAISDETWHACMENPETLLIETYVKAARQHGTKF